VPDNTPSIEQLLAYGQMRGSIPHTYNRRASKAECRKNPNLGRHSTVQVPYEFSVDEAMVKLAGQVLKGFNNDMGSATTWLQEEHDLEEHDAKAAIAIFQMAVDLANREVATKILGQMDSFGGYPARWQALLANGFSENAALYLADVLPWN
jgi:hypothetical protein